MTEGESAQEAAPPGSLAISRENSRAGAPGRGLLRAQPTRTNHNLPRLLGGLHRRMGKKVLCKLGCDVLRGNGFGIRVLRPNLVPNYSEQSVVNQS